MKIPAPNDAPTPSDGSQSAFAKKPRLLTALPVYNEARYLDSVLDLVAQHADDILVIDDGSTDGTAEKLAARSDIKIVTHSENRGYGAALRSAFCYAQQNGYDVLVTIDCDGQHEPQRIRSLAALCSASADGSFEGVDIVSGSRYLDGDLEQTGSAPVDRRHINGTITRELNEQLGLNLTDAFCGFKAYRVAALKPLRLAETGYAMPLELWVQIAHLGLTVQEVAVPLIYLDEDRSFGGDLDDAAHRLAHYRQTIKQAFARVEEHMKFPQPDPCAELAARIESASPATP